MVRIILSIFILMLTTTFAYADFEYCKKKYSRAIIKQNNIADQVNNAWSIISDDFESASSDFYDILYGPFSGDLMSGVYNACSGHADRSSIDILKGGFDNVKSSAKCGLEVVEVERRNKQLISLLDEYDLERILPVLSLYHEELKNVINSSHCRTTKPTVIHNSKDRMKDNIAFFKKFHPNCHIDSQASGLRCLSQ